MPTIDAQYELVSAVILDADISAQACIDAALIVRETQADELQALSIARGEAWRQLRARNVFPHDVPLVDVAGDPVAALTAVERTVLCLSLRLKLSNSDIARVTAISEREVRGLIKTARRELARAAIAMTMMTNPTKCPATATAQTTFGNSLKRGQSMHLVTHAAECSICVPVLRTVDRSVVEDYTNALQSELPSHIAESISHTSSEAALGLVERAKLKNGYAPADKNLSQDPRKLLKLAIFSGAISAVLISLSLFVRLR